MTSCRPRCRFLTTKPIRILRLKLNLIESPVPTLRFSCKRDQSWAVISTSLCIPLFVAFHIAACIFTGSPIVALDAYRVHLHPLMENLGSHSPIRRKWCRATSRRDGASAGSCSAGLWVLKKLRTRFLRLTGTWCLRLRWVLTCSLWDERAKRQSGW